MIRHLNTGCKVQTDVKKIFSLPNIILAIIVIALIGFTIVARVRFLDIPLERDEGEYAYAGQLMLQGVPPYSLAYNMKMPGIYAAYAAILAIFGQTDMGIHLSIIFINTATVVLIFFLARKFFGNIPAYAAAIFFAIVSVSQNITASANAENFVILPAVGAILLLLKFQESKKISLLIISGLLFGLSFMFKQHAFGFILFGLFLVIWNQIRQKPFKFFNSLISVIIFSIAVLLPFLFTCWILWHFGVFEKFWFWTFKYAQAYVTQVPVKSGLKMLKDNLCTVVASAPAIWYFSIFGLASLIWNREIRKNGIFLIAFLVGSILAISPGLYFRHHYFVLFLPVLVMFTGAGIFAIKAILEKIIKSRNASVFISMGFIVVLWANAVYCQRNYFFEKDVNAISRLVFGKNFFIEMKETAMFLKEHSEPNDKIAVLGSEPEIFFYSQRRSASSYIYVYPLMENNPFALQMQREMISQIEAAKPRYIVFVDNRFSWLRFPDSQKLIFEWMLEYGRANYRTVGIVENFGGDKTLYRWQKDAVPSSGIKMKIVVFERNDFSTDKK